MEVGRWTFEVGSWTLGCKKGALVKNNREFGSGILHAGRGKISGHGSRRKGAPRPTRPNPERVSETPPALGSGQLASAGCRGQKTARQPQKNRYGGDASWV
jgi:hypothetical protein